MLSPPSASRPAMTPPIRIPKRSPRRALRRRRRIFASASREAISANFFGDAEAERGFAADLETLASLGAATVEFDIAPFFEVARCSTRGLGRRALRAVRRLLETRPEALHPVTRKIIEGARNFDAVAASRRATGSPP